MKWKTLIENLFRFNFILLGGTFIFTYLYFLTGGFLSFKTSLCIIFASFVVSNYFIGLNKKSYLINFLSLLFLSFLFIYSKQYIDFTYDGQSYHQEMIRLMGLGWNPIYESISNTNNQSIWVNHYSKGYEIIAATFYSLSGSIKSIKFINLAFLFFSFSYPLRYYLLKFSIIKAVLISLIIALNPVTLYQLNTNLIDGFLYSVTIISVYSYILSETNNKSYRLDFIISFLLLLNVKFTGVIFAITFYGIIVLYDFFILKKSYYKIFKKIGVTFLIVTPFLIIPYVKNFTSEGHPFYPLMGKNKIDFIENYVPDILKKESRGMRLVYANFVSIGNRSDSKFKIPFTFSMNEIQKMRNGGPRVGALGPLWGGILLISVLYYLINLYKFRINFKISLYEIIICIIILLLLLNKAGWWFRYTPYYWLLPLFFYLSINRYKKKDGFFINILSFTIFGNAFLILLVSIGLRFKDTRKFEKKLLKLKNKNVKVNFGSYLGNKALFKEYKIAFKEVSLKDMKEKLQLNNQVVIEIKK